MQNTVTNIASETVNIQFEDNITTFHFSTNDGSISYDKVVNSNADVILAIKKCINLVRKLPEYEESKNDLHMLLDTI